VCDLIEKLIVYKRFIKCGIGFELMFWKTLSK